MPAPSPAVDTARAAVGAVSFLTRFPVGRWVAVQPGDVARGAVLFPLVGAGIGAAAGGLVAGLDGRLTAILAACLAVALEALLTGALHLDGLADTADGLGASTRERALEVMREPAVGTFGAAALALDLLVKAAAIAAIASGRDAVLALVVAYALGRAAPLALAWALPYARASGGTGLTLAGASAVWLGAGLAAGAGAAVGLLGLRGLWLVVGAATAVALTGAVARRRFGGVTGDVFGAAVETATAFALVVAAATR
jgi:cobalamin 5'-phosphate synthase/cobalamin synthase